MNRQYLSALLPPHYVLENMLKVAVSKKKKYKIFYYWKEIDIISYSHYIITPFSKIFIVNAAVIKHIL